MREATLAREAWAELGGREADSRVPTGSPARALGIGLATMAAMAALALVAAFLVLPSLRLKRVEIDGAGGLSRDEIFSYAGVAAGDSLLSIDPARVAAGLVSCPKIKSARVDARLPDALHIELVPRSALLLILVDTGTGLEPACLDADGVVYAAAADAASAGALPLLSGVAFEGFRYGDALPAPFSALLGSIAAIASSEPGLLDALSEIRAVDRGGGRFELLLYALHYRVPVRTGSTLSGELLRSMILVLDVIRSEGLDDGAKELDFRSGAPVLRSKEAVSG